MAWPALLIALAGIGLLTAAVFGLAWWRGWALAWIGSWCHLLREAGYRAGGTWLEFADWLRSGSARSSDRP